MILLLSEGFEGLWDSVNRFCVIQGHQYHIRTIDSEGSVHLQHQFGLHGPTLPAEHEIPRDCLLQGVPMPGLPNTLQLLSHTSSGGLYVKEPLLDGQLSL